MQVKCSCGKNIIECNPKGDCWCKKLPYKIRESDINKERNKCLCEKCLKENLKRSRL